MMRSLFVLLFCLLLLPVSGQVEIVKFEGQQFGSGNRISWTVGRGNTCQDLEIQHSGDGLTFTTVFLYAGICGNANFDQTYNWIHPQPLANAPNYYRIITPNVIMTDTITVYFIPFSEAGFVIYPQPAIKEVQLRLDNTNAVRYQLELLDMNGKLVTRLENITETQVTIKNPVDRPATYLLRITREGQEPKSTVLVFN